MSAKLLRLQTTEEGQAGFGAEQLKVVLNSFFKVRYVCPAPFSQVDKRTVHTFISPCETLISVSHQRFHHHNHKTGFTPSTQPCFDQLREIKFFRVVPFLLNLRQFKLVSRIARLSDVPPASP